MCEDLGAPSAQRSRRVGLAKYCDFGPGPPAFSAGAGDSRLPESSDADRLTDRPCKTCQQQRQKNHSFGWGRRPTGGPKSVYYVCGGSRACAGIPNYLFIEYGDSQLQKQRLHGYITHAMAAANKSALPRPNSHNYNQHPARRISSSTTEAKGMGTGTSPALNHTRIRIPNTHTQYLIYRPDCNIYVVSSGYANWAYRCWVCATG